MKLFYIGNLLILILGSFHVLFHFIFLYVWNISEEAVYEEMRSFFMNVLGTKRNLSELFEGFSLCVGVFMIFYSWFNLVLYRRGKEMYIRIPFLFMINALLCFLVAVLSFMFFPWPSSIAFSFCSVLNLYLYMRQKKGFAAK